MSKTTHRVAFVNITWNQYHWRKIDDESKSGHAYVKKNTAHEHVNFKFDKQDIDDETYVYGYAPTFHNKRELRDDDTSVVFFISKSPKDGFKIVGIYGGASQIIARRRPFEGYGKDGLSQNIRGERDYSVYFKHHLDLQKYYSGAVGRAGIKYIKKEDVASNTFPGLNDDLKTSDIEDIEEDVAKRIILEEFTKCDEKGESITKLRSIFEFITGHNIEEEKRRIAEELVSSEPLEEINKALRSDSKIITFKGKSVQRDLVAIENIKNQRGYKCQICDIGIKRKNKPPYVEGAHIIPKNEKGSEHPRNILVLCPNHHKEFDYGERKIIDHGDTAITFSLNGITHHLDIR